MNVVALKRAPSEPRIVTALIAVSKQTRAMLGIRLAEIGLATGEDDVIMAMSDGRPICTVEISQKLGIRYETTQRLVEQLLAHGRVENAESPLYRLSKNGFELVGEIASLRTRLGDDLEKLLGSDAVEDMTEYLEKIEAGFGQAFKTTV